MRKIILNPVLLYSIDELQSRVKQELIESEICGYLYDEGIEISEEDALDKLRKLGARYYADGSSALVIDNSIYMDGHNFYIASICDQ